MSELAVVVTRVAVTWAGKAPSRAWLRRRIPILRELGAPCLAAASVPLVWVWQTCRLRAAEVADAAAVMSAMSDLKIVVAYEDARPRLPMAKIDSVTAFRMDSDDAILPDTIDAVTRGRLPDGHMVEFTRGWQMNLQTGELGYYVRTSKQVSPLFAIGRGRDNPTDVWGYHTHKVTPEHRAPWPKPAIIQGIHDGNASNRWSVTTDPTIAYRGGRVVPAIEEAVIR